MKTEIEKLKQINQTGNNKMDHTHQNPQKKIQTEQKMEVRKTGQPCLKQEAK